MAHGLAWLRRRRFAVAAASGVLVSLVFACNGIVGLNDFEAVECTGGQCDGGAFDSPIDAFTGGDSGPEGGPKIDASGTAPVSWAHFPMPNHLRDGGPDANIPTYTTTTNGGVQDSVTKLTWLEPIPPALQGTHGYADAKALCASAGSGGTVWRLPSRIELVTLLDVSKTPAIDTSKFASTVAQPYWTSSEVRPFGGTDGTSNHLHWTVDFSANAGVGSAAEEDGKEAVRCVLAQ